MIESIKKISVIIPCYNEAPSIPLFYEEIIKLANDMPYVIFEFIFVDDGSRDKSITEMKKLNHIDQRVRYISFSRNFGKEAAMYAGLKNSVGDYAVIIDVDLQHPPQLIKKMYDGIQNEGYDCVATKRMNRRGEPKIRLFFSTIFYKLINKISDITISEGATDYRLMKRKMVDSILEMTEYNRFSKGIFEWVGFDTKWITIEIEERKAGATTWSFWSLLKYSMEGFLAYSTKPLLLSSLAGMAFCIIAILYGMYIVIKTIIIGDVGSGWPTIVCLTLFLSGVQLFCIGILGQYMAKTYLETKQRPIYIVKQTEKDIKDI